jgi:hypothetical protein
VTVREVAPLESASLSAVDMPRLLTELNTDRVSILKLEIEGAEKTLFSAVDLSWLSRVDAIVIELHGEECSRVFLDAIQGHDFVISTCDELTVCRRPAVARSQ